MSDNVFDLLVIGGGSGGLAVAEKAAQFGKKVAIVESTKLGGTCVNVGCVPKKIMWYAANLAHAVDDAAGFGIPAQRGSTDWKKLVTGREQYIANINRFWDGYVTDLDITHITGYAEFVDQNTLIVDAKLYSAEHIVIATGGKPFVPSVPGADLGITSDGFFQLEQLPKRVAVIGSGYIGIELGGVLQALGSEVTVLAPRDRILKTFDTLISDTLA
jgi:glutathione reductase (NADPH)